MTGDLGAASIADIAATSWRCPSFWGDQSRNHYVASHDPECSGDQEVMPGAASGYYQDPLNPEILRYWTGTYWTVDTRTAAGAEAQPTLGDNVLVAMDEFMPGHTLPPPVPGQRKSVPGGPVASTLHWEPSNTAILAAEDMELTATALQQRMELNDEERLAFGWCVLHLMNRDLVGRGQTTKKHVECVAVRDEYRSAVASGEIHAVACGEIHTVVTAVDGERASAGNSKASQPLPHEDPLYLLPYLSRFDDLAHNLSIVVDLAVAEPWYMEKVRTSKEARRIALAEICGSMGGSIKVSDAYNYRIEASIMEATGVCNMSSHRALWMLGAATVGMFLTGGLLAPAIAGMFGGMGGLVGAAAVAHGLALLGGGSLAAGGFGMAGGMALLTGVGAVGGATVAGGLTHNRIAAWEAFSPDQAAVEAVKSYALIRALRQHDETQDEAAKARTAFRDQTNNLIAVVAIEEAKGEAARQAESSRHETAPGSTHSSEPKAVTATPHPS